MYSFLVAILLLDAVILATAVLLQAGQGGGLATMGGGAGTESIMGGRQATTLLTKVTWWTAGIFLRSEEHTSELQSRFDLVCRLLLEKKKKKKYKKKKEKKHR